MVVNQVGHSAELLKKVLLRRRNSFLTKRFAFMLNCTHKSVTVGKVYLSVWSSSSPQVEIRSVD